MVSKKLFLTLTIALGLAGVAAGALLNPFRPAPRPMAIWKDVYKAPKEMARDVDAVLIGRVTGIEPGRVAVSENGEHALFFELAELETLSSVKGTSPGERVLVERLSVTNLDGEEDQEAVALDADGGPFEPGKTYLLFLKRQEDGQYYYQVNNQGRFLVDGGRLRAADPADPVPALLHGKPVGAGLALLRERRPAK